MELTSEVRVFFLLFQVFSTSTSRICRFEIESLSSSWVQKPCVFFFDNPTKTKFIGSEFQLRDDTATKEAFQIIGANFNKFVKSPLTVWNDSCDCTKVPCLNVKQLNNLFAYSMEQARKEAILRFSFFPRLCCSLQQVVEEIIYKLQAEDAEKLVKITMTEENIHMHSRVAYLSYGLEQTKWCKTFKTKCDKFIYRIAEGCADERRQRRDIGFKTTTACQSSSCFQDTQAVSSSPPASIAKASLVEPHVLASTSRQQLTSAETTPFARDSSQGKTKQVIFTTTAGTENSREKTLQVLAWNSDVYTSSSTPFSSHSWKFATTQVGASSFFGELLPSPSMSPYMTQPMASERRVTMNGGGSKFLTVSDVKSEATASRNTTRQFAARISNETSFAQFLASVTRPLQKIKSLTSTVSTDEMGKSSALSSDSTSHLRRRESVAVETFSSKSSLAVYSRSASSSSILGSISTERFISIYLSVAPKLVSLTPPSLSAVATLSSSSLMLTSPTSSSSSSLLSPFSQAPSTAVFESSSSSHSSLSSSSTSPPPTQLSTSSPSSSLTLTLPPSSSSPSSPSPASSPASSSSSPSSSSSRTLSQTFVFSSKPSPTSPTFTKTFLVKFEGNCSVISNKVSFKVSFMVTLANLLRLSKSDVIVYDVTCGSVDVTFTIRNTRDRNLTVDLWRAVNNTSFVIKYNGKVFKAFEVKIVSQPAATTTSSPTSVLTPTSTSKHERKKLLFIIFVFFGTIFAALFVFFSVIFLSRYCACCQKSEKLRMHKKVRLRARDFELKRFALRRNQCLGASYYGEIATLEQNRTKDIEIVEEDINDYYEDEFAEGHQGDTNTSLLNSNNHGKRNTLVFDDEDSCSSILFY